MSADDNVNIERWKAIEYEQVSEDWRHRDVLTWQLPAVLVVVGGVLVREAFDQQTPPWIGAFMLLLAVALAWCLTMALKQNLDLQSMNRVIAENLYPETKRFPPRKLGSRRLLKLSWVVSIFLAATFLLMVVKSLIALTTLR